MQLKEFDWNKGNINKNLVKHKVDFRETEEIFFNRPVKFYLDKLHSQTEVRYTALGITNKKRILIISYTIRTNKIRIISAKMAKVKRIPKFKNEDEERDFWDKHDFADYFDLFKPVEMDLSELKPSTKPITVRLTESLIASLKQLAHKKDVPYQSLMKIYLEKAVERDYQRMAI